MSLNPMLFHLCRLEMFNYVDGRGHSSALFCVISGFRSDVHEICDYLGFYAVSIGNPISTFRAKISDPSTRVSVEL